MKNRFKFELRTKSSLTKSNLFNFIPFSSLLFLNESYKKICIVSQSKTRNSFRFALKVDYFFYSFFLSRMAKADHGREHFFYLASNLSSGLFDCSIRQESMRNSRAICVVSHLCFFRKCRVQAYPEFGLY